MDFRRALASNTIAVAFAMSAASAYAQPSPELYRPAASASAAAPVVKASTRTEWNPYFPFWVLGLAGASYLLFCGYGAKKHGMKGTAARAFAGAVLVYGAANHQQITEQRESLSTETLIVVDDSPSQSLGDRTTSTADAHAALDAALKALPGVNVRIVRVGGEKDGMSANSTKIFGTIDDALSDVPRDRLGGIWVLSDGQIHDQNIDKYSPGEGVPVHTLLSGRKGEFDRRLEKTEVSDFGLVNKKQDIKFVLADDGPVQGAGGKVRVSIHQDGKQIATQMVTPGQTETATIEVTHAGANIFEIKTDTVKGEVTDVNNRIVASIEGIHEKLNVLLISGSPNPNTRMWRKLLKSDADVNPVHFMVQRFPEQVDDTPREEYSLTPFPMNEVFAENLGRFNLIILDHYENRNLLSSSYIDNIVSYVKKGGALVVASGPEYAGSGSIYNTPLGAILPAEPTKQITERAFSPRISDQGQKHPVTRGLEGGNLPKDQKSQPTWGAWFRSIDVKTPAGDVIMEGPDKKPLVILSHQEKGRVAMINSDSLWRWERGYDTKGPYGSLLLNTAHWAMKNPAMDEEALKITHQGKDLVIEQQTMAAKSTPVTIRTPSNKSIAVTPEAAEPGKWRFKIPAQEMGLYSAEQGGKHARVALVNVGPTHGQEFIHTISTPDILQPVATRTGGLLAQMTNPSGVLALPVIRAVAPESKDKALSGPDWMGVRMTAASELRESKKEQFIDNRILAALLFLSMATAYIMQAGKNPFRRDKAAGAPVPKGPGA